jgi:uncharacterized delta-60 repeat protein
MLTQKRLRCLARFFYGLLAALMTLSFSAAGLAKPAADETTTIEVFLPYVIQHGVYQECIGVLDTSFSQDGWLLTNYSGSLDDGRAIVIQPDGKLVMAGSFNPTSADFGLARFTVDGSEDPSFDGDGRVYTDFFGEGDWVFALALQSDGKIVAAGSAYYNDENRDDFALARYNPDGSLDTGFGSNGRVTTDFLGGADSVTAIVIQTDGRIVVAGYAYNGGDYDFALARYNPNGSLDTTFSGDGKVVTDLTTKRDFVFALVLVGDKLVVVGEARNGTYNDFALVRYNADGSLDASFDGDGIVFTDFGGFTDGARAVALQQDGKLVVAGFRKDAYSNDFALARYNSNGSLDDAFGDEGKVVTDIYGGDEYGYAVMLESGSGNLVVGGYILNETQNDFALARYTPNGTLDNTFDGDGIVVSDYAGRSEWGYGLVQQGDGKLILAGYMLTVAGSDFTMARYNGDGTLDLSFSEDGWVVTNLFGSNDQGLAAAMQPDGKLVVAGWVEEWEGSDFAVARYYANGSPDPSFDVDGRLVTDINGDYDYAYAVAVQPDGKIVVAGTAFNTDGWNDDFALVRYNSDGSLDLDFGIDGRVISDYGEDDNGIQALLVLPDGKLIVAGYAFNGDNYDFALARYNSDGTLDPSFGTGGWVLTDFFDDDDHGWAIARQVDGKLLVAGYATNGGEYDFALARYTVNGSLDATFDGDGLVVTDINANDQGHAIAVQGDGKILVAGWSNNGTQDDFAIVRYNPNGSLDSTFDGDGRVVTDISGNNDRLTTVALDLNGKVMVGGMVYASVETGYDFALARYLPNGSLDPSFSANGWLTFDFYAGDDSVQVLLMQPGGQVVVAGYADNGTDYDFALARYR